MRSRVMLAAVVLSTAIVSGGWLVERGLAGTAGPKADAGRLFDEVYSHVKHDFVDTLTDSTIYARAAEGLVTELHDPHSSYLSADLLARLSERTTGKYAGVGAQIDVRDGWVTVVAPLPGGPALDAGIQTGDRIVSVNDKSMRGLTSEEAQKNLRGDPGSVARLTIERPGVSAPLKFALTRRAIHLHSVQHAALLRDGVGYVALTIFSEESVAELRAAIDSLRGAGMKSLIFDLRADPGGLLDQGVGVSDLFLDPGQTIVSMRGRTEANSRTFADRAPQPWPQLPVAVLVDSNSASAAEIVAGALQDHDRALLLGTATYGKGSAQNVFQLPNGSAVKLTTALWYTPSGRSINRKRPGEDGARPDTSAKRPRYTTDGGRSVLGGGGITPDVLLPPIRIAPGDTAFQRSLGAKIPEFRDAITDYALALKVSHGVKSPEFTVTPAMRAELLRRMRARGITITDAAFEAGQTVVDRLLSYDVARYVFGVDAEWARRLRDDPNVAATLALVSGVSSPQELLSKGAKP
jgi:carboxyl-terminal processing protease